MPLSLTLVSPEPDAARRAAVRACAEVTAAGGRVKAQAELRPGAQDLRLEGDFVALLAAADRTAADLPVDVCLQPAAGRRKRLMLADMDSTIIGCEGLDELADYAGRKAEVAAVTERAMRGELEFAPALRARVATLAGLPVSAVARCLHERVRLNPGARVLVRTLAAHGVRTVLVSGGFESFARPVAAMAGFAAARANRLLDDGERLTGRVGEPILGREAKLEALQQEAAALGLLLEETMAVGDGANDLAMIGAAGLGVACRAKPVVAAEADARIAHADLTALLYFQGYAEADFIRDLASGDVADAAAGCITAAARVVSAMPTREDVLAALDGVRDPKSGRGLAAAGLVQGLVVADDRAGFMLEVAPADAALYAPVREAAEAVLRGLPGVARTHVALTAEAPQLQVTPRTPPARGPTPPSAAAPHGRPAAAGRPAHVRRVVAVASGKGGVGKSTLAVNLACAFARLGLSTGLLDADVYGPSAPRMFGLSGSKPGVDGEKKILPLRAWGVAVASIGFLVDEGAPMIWRGPMASSAVGQLLNDVRWGTSDAPLDVLVVDMPPGTGDVQLTLAQKVSVDGAVIVSTPQEVALIDVRRGAAMFEKTATPILGVVENMSFFPDPATGAPIPIFGHGGARGVAAELGVPFLGEVPIDMALRQGGDDGRPATAAVPDGASARALMEIAAAVLARLEDGAGAKPAPRIVRLD